MAPGKRRLVSVDEAAVVSDYEADVTVAAICATHDIGLVRLYRILDQHRIPRRRPNAPKLPKRLRERILKDYIAGVATEEIARRHGVSPQTVSNVAVRRGVARNPLRSRDELVELIVRWFTGDDPMAVQMAAAQLFFDIDGRGHRPARR